MVSAFRYSPSAFSIVEVLFAVMILGIGFIMVAAIFPVGIQQGRDAIDDTTGRTIARAAANRAAAAFHSIGDAARASNFVSLPDNLGTLKGFTDTAYQPIHATDPTVFPLPPSAIITNGLKSGTVGGGGLNLYQLAGGDWQYLGQDQYISQLFFRTTYMFGQHTGTLNIVALAMRDGRDAGDKSTPLSGAAPSGRLYVKPCEVATDAKANIYSDIYIRTADSWTEAQIRAFLGTAGTVVRTPAATPSDQRLIRMADSVDSLKFTTPPATAVWESAYMFSSDIPVIGSYTLTTSLP